jgi:hypothetical protein
MDDAEYESFWYNFKDSVVNFTRASPSPLYDPILSRLPKVSSALNELQKEKRYEEIIIMIETFLTDFLWISLKNPETASAPYHLKIANTNLKRWTALGNTGKNRIFNLVKIVCSIACTKNPHPDTIGLITEIEKIELDFVRVITIIVSYAYKHKMNTVLTRLLADPECQRYTVAVLHKMNIMVPEHIRNGAKIFNI